MTCISRVRRRVPGLEDLKRECADFNAMVPIGSAVSVKTDNGTVIRTKTRSAACVVYKRSAAILLQGFCCPQLLERVKP